MTSSQIPDPSAGWEDDDLPEAPEESRGAEDFGITAAEERDGEPLTGRLNRELPDATLDATTESETRLVQPDEGAHADTEKDEVAGVAGHQEDLSAEESAIHADPRS